MININKNHSLTQLNGLVEQSLHRKLNYMPDEFNEQQQYALELFQKRIFLEKTIDEAISFNKKLVWDDSDENLHLVKTAEELIEVYKLRSDVYTKLGYQDEFPDAIEGLNFDKYDSCSAILYFKMNSEITGTTRLIFDQQSILPSEENHSFKQYRKKHNNISELSRLIVKNKKHGLHQEFRNLTKGIYNIYKYNNVDLILSGMKMEHFKLYSRFGGFVLEKELDTYGSFTVPCIITSWDPSLISKFFKRTFLS